MSQGGVLECAVVGVPGRAFRRGGQAVRGEEVAGAERARTAQVHAAANSPATRCRSTSNSATSCRRPMSARFCAARCATTHERSGNALPSAADVVAFWRAAGPERWFKKDAAFDDEIRRRFLATHEAAAAGKLTDWEAERRGRAGAAHSARPVSAQHVPRRRRAPSPPIRWRAPSPAAPSSTASTARSPTCAAFSICRSSIRKISPTRSAAIALYQGDRRCRRPEMGRTARRHHPPLRPLPAPQRRARPRHHAGGAGLSRRRWLCRVNSVMAGLVPAIHASNVSNEQSRGCPAQGRA